MMANVPPSNNRRKHALGDPTEAFCIRREEFINDGACLNCFLHHAQLQFACRLRSHCAAIHLVSS